MTSKLTPAIAKAITADWQSFFPEFAIWKPRHLVRRHGPLITGILLERDSSNDNYLPLTYAHCLASRDEITLMVNTKLRSRRTNAVDHVSVGSHEHRWREAAERLEQQSRIPLRGPVALDASPPVF